MTDSPPSDLPPIEDCGFIRVPAAADSPGQDLWMTCEQCGKSDHFWLDDAVNCRCGARYGVAVRPDGSQVRAADLRQVPFSLGPKQLGSWELDPVRVAILAGVISAITAGLVAWFW